MIRIALTTLLPGLVAVASVHATTLAGVELPDSVTVDGTTLVLNGKALGSIPGDDFARALFTVWFGPKPGDENLKRGMLGK
jgi:chalcone isomerase-like protein